MASSKFPSYSSWLLERIATGDAVRLLIGVTTIGRTNAVINISDSHYVSRRHGELLIAENDVVEIVDLDSVNGTCVNGVLYRDTKVELHANDRIGVGVLDSCEDDPQYPVFRLKYVPLRRSSVKLNKPKVDVDSVTPCSSATRAAAASTLATTSSVISSSESLGTTPLSRPNVPFVTTAGPTTVISTNDVITLSDDEDDGRSSGIVEKSVEGDICDLMQEDIVTSSDITTTHSAIEMACDSTVFSNQENLKSKSLAATAAPKSPNISTTSVSAISMSTGINDDRLVSKAASKSVIHAPFIPDVKRELIRTVSENIQNIFGETDDVILESVKELNPFVYNNLNSNSKNEVKLRNGDFIDLSSDIDEEDSEFVEDHGAFVPVNEVQQFPEDENSNSQLQTKSANISKSLTIDENYRHEVKRKFMKNPSYAKRREEEEKKCIQASQKERLKELTGKQTIEVNEETSKQNAEPSVESDKRANVKNTLVNRLTEELKQKMPYKISNVKSQKRELKSAPNKSVASTALAKTGKSANAVRAQRTKRNKITFASMQKNYVESRKNEEILMKLAWNRHYLANSKPNNPCATAIP